MRNDGNSKRGGSLISIVVGGLGDVEDADDDAFYSLILAPNLLYSLLYEY
jgi:hypothetical protein